MEDIKIIIANKENYIKWLNKIRKGSGNARPLWLAMTPKIQEFINFQFNETGDTGKRWRKLKPSYKKWKKKKGFSTAIGVMTGKLKKAAGIEADKKYSRKSLIWLLDNSVAVSKKGVRYAKYFNSSRPVYRNVALRTTSFLNQDIKNFPNGAGFTFNWLKNSLKPFV